MSGGEIAATEDYVRKLDRFGAGLRSTGQLRVTVPTFLRGCAPFDNPETTIPYVYGILAVRGFSALMLLKIQDLLCSGSARHKILMPRARPKEYLSLCPVSNC